MPALPNKALITKGIFAVSVVAVTATVGVVSFAQAAKPLDNGYGGGAAAIQAAVQEFQGSVHNASTQFNNDINACLGSFQETPAAHVFKNQTNSSIGDLSSQFANPSSISRNQNQMKSKLTDAVNDQDQKLAADATQLSTSLDQASGNLDVSGLNQCLANARTDFHVSIQEARQKLLDAIHNALQ